MVIRNKKIIGLISILIGLTVLSYEGYYLSIAFFGKKTEAEVTGFVFYRNGVQKVQNESSNSNPFIGRSPFVKFKIENDREIEAYSKTLQLFTFSGYHLGNKIIVAYKPDNPQQIFIMNTKEIPGLILMFAFGFVLILMGKSFLFFKTKSSKK